jgi:hypothetical protein
MLRNANFSAGFVSLYLVAYCVMLQLEKTRDYAVIMFFLSPLIVCWMVYTVIKLGNYNGKSLANDEFGYQDKDKNGLGIF